MPSRLTIADYLRDEVQALRTEVASLRAQVEEGNNVLVWMESDLFILVAGLIARAAAIARSVRRRIRRVEQWLGLGGIVQEEQEDPPSNELVDVLIV